MALDQSARHCSSLGSYRSKPPTMWVDLVGMAVAVAQGKASLSGRKSGQLALDASNVGALGGEADASDEGGEARLDLDLG
jgi:hypothetical protein